MENSPQQCANGIPILNEHPCFQFDFQDANYIRYPNATILVVLPLCNSILQRNLLTSQIELNEKLPGCD